MITIKLEQVRLHGLHGVYSGEPLVGGEFEITLEVDFDDKGIEFDSLSDTISYVALLDTVKKHMSVPTPLLEKLGKLILDDIYLNYPFIKGARFDILKLQAPIAAFQGRVGVSLNRVY
jgi:dihydroneopterin aldolase